MKIPAKNHLRLNKELQCFLTLPFHHDRGRFEFAVSPRRGEQAALGRRLRRGQQFYSDVINALRAKTKNLISC
jgi:hypothetical protein